MSDNSKTAARLHRSPQYPSLGLRKAVELTKKFWSIHRKDRITGDKAIVDIGYQPTGSTGQRALAALVSYGLLHAAGPKGKRQVWISDLGRRIVNTPEGTSTELIDDLRLAAGQPTILGKIYSKYPDTLPPRPTLKMILMRDMEFNESAVDSFVDVILDTFDYAQLGKGAILPVSDEQEEQDSLEFETEQYGQPGKESQSRGGTMFDQSIGQPHKFNFPLLGGGSIIVQAPPVVSQRDLKRFLTWWDVTSEALVSPQDSAEKKPAEDGKQES